MKTFLFLTISFTLSSMAFSKDCPVTKATFAEDFQVKSELMKLKNLIGETLAYKDDLKNGEYCDRIQTYNKYLKSTKMKLEHLQATYNQGEELKCTERDTKFYREQAAVQITNVKRYQSDVTKALSTSCQRMPATESKEVACMKEAKSFQELDSMSRFIDEIMDRFH